MNAIRICLYCKSKVAVAYEEGDIACCVGQACFYVCALVKQLQIFCMSMHKESFCTTCYIDEQRIDLLNLVGDKLKAFT